jgi:hypothetical protein
MGVGVLFPPFYGFLSPAPHTYLCVEYSGKLTSKQGAMLTGGDSILSQIYMILASSRIESQTFIAW